MRSRGALFARVRLARKADPEISVISDETQSAADLFLPTRFSGKLTFAGKAVETSFEVRITSAGTTEVALDRILLTSETTYLLDAFRSNDIEPARLNVIGQALDGTSFTCDRLQLLGSHTSTDKDHVVIQLSVSPVTAELHFARKDTAAAQVMRLRVRGFRNFRMLSADCTLGFVHMYGPQETKDANELTGGIVITRAEGGDSDPQWEPEAEKLLEHIRRIMSFASSAVLRAPILEYFSGDHVKVAIQSVGMQSTSALRTVHFLDQEAIFTVAVSSFFVPPVPCKDLFFAIEWFCMDASYDEVRLLNAMTTLELLLASNLSLQEVLFRPSRQFKKIRRALRNVLKTLATDANSELYGASLEEISLLNERLADVNRRSFFDKLMTLASKWSVPLDDVGLEAIKNAKRARDQVVHRGLYGDGDVETAPRTWEHFVVLREIALRFVFAAVGYKGSYISYVNGYHNVQYPPSQGAHPSSRAGAGK